MQLFLCVIIYHCVVSMKCVGIFMPLLRDSVFSVQSPFKTTYLYITWKIVVFISDYLLKRNGSKLSFNCLGVFQFLWIQDMP